MLNRLVTFFIENTANIKTKRLIEALLNDWIYVVYFIIVFVCFWAVVAFDTTVGFFITALIFMLLLSGWGWMSYHIRKTFLTMLYPPSEKTNENGDSEDDSIDRLNSILKDFAKELNVDLKDEKIY